MARRGSPGVSSGHLGLASKGAPPDEDAAVELLYLSIQNTKKKWGGRARSWQQELLQFAIHFPGRISE